MFAADTMQNDFVESFNGSFRDECLNQALSRRLLKPAQPLPRERRITTGTDPPTARQYHPGELAVKMATENWPHEARSKTKTLPKSGGKLGVRSPANAEPGLLQRAGTYDGGSIIEAKIHLAERPNLFRQTEPLPPHDYNPLQALSSGP